MQELKNTYKNARNVTVGLSHHSLRAVSKKEMIVATEEARKIFPDLPIHIHIAEQMKEVQECEQVHNMRPVEYLFDSIKVDEKWCLVHATHMNDNEIKMLAKSGAVAGLCPTTEANLGDGIFNLTDYIKHGGKFGIGSDSNTSVSVSEELRLLEYSQRLKHQRRNLACDEHDNHVGAYLFKNAAKSGAQALGIHGGEIRVGARADFVSLYDDHEILCGKEGDTILDSYVFAGNKPLVSDVILGGKTVIRNSHHPREYDITLRFKKLMYRLNS